MTIARVKGASWGANEKLTSGQQNALDINVTYALDKRAGQTDTLSSGVTVASGGSITMASGSSFATVAGCPSLFDGTFRANGTAYFYGVSTFNGLSTFNSNVTVNANLSVGATLTSSSVFNATGASTLSGTTTLSGATTATNFTMTSTNRVRLASRSITRVICSHFVPYTSNWSLQSDPLGTPSTTAASNEYGGFPLSLPDGAVITQIRVVVAGAPSHSAAPANLPVASLYYKVPGGGGTGALIATQTDTYTSAVAYSTPHYITMGSIGYTVDRLARLVVYVQSESGANALSGFKIHGFDVTYTVINYDDGGTCN